MKWIKQIRSQLCPLSIYAKTKPEAQTEVNVSGVKRLLRVQLWRMWRHRQQLREFFWMHGHLCTMVQCNEKINPLFTQVTPYSVPVVRVPNSLVSYPTRWSLPFILGPLHWSTSREHRNIVQFKLVRFPTHLLIEVAFFKVKRGPCLSLNTYGSVSAGLEKCAIRLEICQKIDTTQFSDKRILHIENA